MSDSREASEHEQWKPFLSASPINAGMPFAVYPDEMVRLITEYDKLIAEIAELKAEIEPLRKWYAESHSIIDEWDTKCSALKAERDKASADFQFMVDRAADQHLDGYRELGRRAAQAENDRDALKSRVERLEAELMYWLPTDRYERIFGKLPGGEG